LVSLPAILHEVKAIEKICRKNDINAHIFTIDVVKEDTIAYFSGDRAPSIVHFATHGAYLPPLSKRKESLAIAPIQLSEVSIRLAGILLSP